MLNYEIHHIDGDNKNNDPSNLDHITRVEHCKRHIGMNQNLQAALVYLRCNDYEKEQLAAFKCEISRGLWAKEQYGNLWDDYDRNEAYESA